MTRNAVRRLIKAVEENNEINDGRWSDWETAQDIAETYDIAIDDDDAKVLQDAIDTNGDSLAEDLPRLEKEIWGKNFSGSWWDIVAKQHDPRLRILKNLRSET